MDKVRGMSMGRRGGEQTPMWIAGPTLARSPGHRFYETLNELLKEGSFDRRVEALCASSFEADNKPGRPSVAPGVYFRMLFVGYFEGIESERGLEWRCSDSLSLRTFLGVQVHERVPDHSTLSRMRTRLDGAVYDEVFRLVLGIVEAKGLLRGKVAGVDSTYLRADASMKTIVRKDTGDDYAAYLKKLCEAQGVASPTAEEARQMDRKRKGKKTSNKEWASPTDSDARIVRLKDGRTRLGYKAEHVVDIETGAVVAAQLYKADETDTATLRPSLEAARENISAARNDGDTSESEDRGDDDDGSPPGESCRRERESRSRWSPTRATTRWSCSSSFAGPSIERTFLHRRRRGSAASRTRAGCSPAKPFTRTAPGCGAPKARSSCDCGASASSGPSPTRARPAPIGACACAAGTTYKSGISPTSRP